MTYQHALTHVDFHEHGIAQTMRNLIDSARRKLLDQSSNLAAIPISNFLTKPIVPIPTTLSSGSFPAVPLVEQQNLPPVPPPNAMPPSNQDQYPTEQKHSIKGTSKQCFAS